MSTDSFNLPPPDGFRGLDPYLPIRMYVRHLPHWRQAGATYFVTFRLADSIPQSQLESLKRWREVWELEHPEPRSNEDWHAFAREITSRTEAYMDEGYGACVLRDSGIAVQMIDAMFHFQHERWLLGSFVVMPNHVHLVTKPLGDHQLEDTLGSVKKFVSRRIPDRAHLVRRVWAQESYDRIIRDEEHLYRAIQYIGRNPAKARLSPSEYRRWILPEWEQQGYGFKS